MSAGTTQPDVIKSRQYLLQQDRTVLRESLQLRLDLQSLIGGFEIEDKAVVANAEANMPRYVPLCAPGVKRVQESVIRLARYVVAADSPLRWPERHRSVLDSRQVGKVLGGSPLEGAHDGYRVMTHVHHESTDGRRM